MFSSHVLIILMVFYLFFNIMQNSTVQQSTAQHCTILWCIVKCSTMRYLGTSRLSPSLSSTEIAISTAPEHPDVMMTSSALRDTAVRGIDGIYDEMEEGRGEGNGKDVEGRDGGRAVPDWFQVSCICFIALSCFFFCLVLLNLKSRLKFSSIWRNMWSDIFSLRFKSTLDPPLSSCWQSLQLILSQLILSSNEYVSVSMSLEVSLSRFLFSYENVSVKVDEQLLLDEILLLFGIAFSLSSANSFSLLISLPFSLLKATQLNASTLLEWFKCFNLALLATFETFSATALRATGHPTEGKYPSDLLLLRSLNTSLDVWGCD